MVTKAKIVGIIGAILIFGGIFAAVYIGILPSSDSGTKTIPAGAEWYYVYQVRPLSGGHVSGTFSVEDYGSVVVYVLDQTNYDNLINNGWASSTLADTGGESGTFSADLAPTGNTYVVFLHMPGWDGISQSVRISMTVSGIDFTYVVVGIAAMVVGAVLIILARKMMTDQAASMLDKPIAPKPSDVTLFQDGEPPIR
jgi:hypothetical protein